MSYHNYGFSQLRLLNYDCWQLYFCHKLVLLPSVITIEGYLSSIDRKRVRNSWIYFLNIVQNDLNPQRYSRIWQVSDMRYTFRMNRHSKWDWIAFTNGIWNILRGKRSGEHSPLLFSYRKFIDACWFIYTTEYWRYNHSVWFYIHSLYINY